MGIELKDLNSCLLLRVFVIFFVQILIIWLNIVFDLLILHNCCLDGGIID